MSYAYSFDDFRARCEKAGGRNHVHTKGRMGLNASNPTSSASHVLLPPEDTYIHTSAGYTLLGRNSGVALLSWHETHGKCNTGRHEKSSTQALDDDSAHVLFSQLRLAGWAFDCDSCRHQSIRHRNVQCIFPRQTYGRGLPCMKGPCGMVVSSQGAFRSSTLDDSSHLPHAPRRQRHACLAVLRM